MENVGLSCHAIISQNCPFLIAGDILNVSNIGCINSTVQAVTIFSDNLHFATYSVHVCAPRSLYDNIL